MTVIGMKRCSLSYIQSGTLHWLDMSKLGFDFDIKSRIISFFICLVSVALIQIVGNILFGPNVMPVRLSPDHVREDGLIATVAGFGWTNVTPKTPILQFIDSTLISNADCRRHYSRNQRRDLFLFNAVRIFGSNICFSNLVGRSTCGGDSGGSIVSGNVSVSCDLFLKWNKKK